MLFIADKLGIPCGVLVEPDWLLDDDDVDEFEVVVVVVVVDVVLALLPPPAAPRGPHGFGNG